MSNRAAAGTGGGGAGYHAKIIITEGGYYDVVVGSGGGSRGARGNQSATDTTAGAASKFSVKDGETLITAGGGGRGTSDQSSGSAGGGGTLTKSANLKELEVFVSRNGYNGSARNSAGSLGRTAGPISGHDWGSAAEAGCGYNSSSTGYSKHGYFSIKYVGPLVTFTINSLTEGATVTLSATGFTQEGNSITVPAGTNINWKVSKTDYRSQEGSFVLNNDGDVSVELDPWAVEWGVSTTSNLNNSTGGLWWGLVYDGEKFVALRTDGYLSTSQDGLNWTTPTQDATLGSNSWKSLCKYGNKLVAISSDGKTSIYTPGSGWSTPTTNTSIGTFVLWEDIVYDGTKFVALNQDGFITTSTDAVNWSTPAREDYVVQFWKSLAYNGETFVAIGDNGYVKTSTDGINWTASVSKIGSHSWNDVEYDGSKFVAISRYGWFTTSNDGVNWETPVQNTNIGSHNWAAISSNGKRLVCIGYSGSYVDVARYVIEKRYGYLSNYQDKIITTYFTYFNEDLSKLEVGDKVGFWEPDFTDITGYNSWVFNRAYAGYLTVAEIGNDYVVLSDNGSLIYYTNLPTFNLTPDMPNVSSVPLLYCYTWVDDEGTEEENTHFLYSPFLLSQNNISADIRYVFDGYTFNTGDPEIEIETADNIEEMFGDYSDFWDGNVSANQDGTTVVLTDYNGGAQHTMTLDATRNVYKWTP